MSSTISLPTCPGSEIDQRLKHLGVTLDQALSYREHLSRSAEKLKSRNNLIAKVTGTSLGASISTIHTSALALCY